MENDLLGDGRWAEREGGFEAIIICHGPRA